MSFKLRDVIKKSKGGMIGVTVGGEQKWFDENEFMDMFEKEGTKEVLTDAIKHGRSKGTSLPEDEYPEPTIQSKTDISETKAQKWDETESSEVFEENMAKQPPPEPAAATEPPGPMQEIESKAKPSPYGREEEFEKITPQNFPVFEKRTREMLNNKLKAFDFLKKLHPGDIAKRKIAESEETWFDEFAQRNSPREGMQYALMDDYKKDKDPDMKQFLYDWQRELTIRKEDVFDRTNNKYFAAKQQRDKLRIHVENQLDAKREEMNEMTKAAKEEAKKYTPENRVKDMKAIAKAKRNLADATEVDDKDEVAALKEEVKLLEERLGIKPSTDEKRLEPSQEGKGELGLKNEDKMRERLKKKNYTDEQIESTLKAYAARKKA